MSTQDQATAKDSAQRTFALTIAACAVIVMSIFAVSAAKETIDHSIYLASKCK